MSASSLQPDDSSFLRVQLQDLAFELHAAQSSPSVLYRPKISKDGDQWCALLGENIQTGVVGFGNTPQEACKAFDAAWCTAGPKVPDGPAFAQTFAGGWIEAPEQSQPSEWIEMVHPTGAEMTINRYGQVRPRLSWPVGKGGCVEKTFHGSKDASDADRMNMSAVWAVALESLRSPRSMDGKKGTL